VKSLLEKQKTLGLFFGDDLHGLVREYFYRSMAGDWTGFNWEAIAEKLEHHFRRKSVEHGFLGWKEYAEFMKRIGIGPRVVNQDDVMELRIQRSDAIPEELELRNRQFGYSITARDIYERIEREYDLEDPYGMPSPHDVWVAAMKEHVERLQEIFGGSGVHKDIYEIYKDLRDIQSLLRKKKINVINRAIHAEHETGDVVDDLWPEEAREDAEAKYQKRRKSKVARVRNNPRFI